MPRAHRFVTRWPAWNRWPADEIVADPDGYWRAAHEWVEQMTTADADDRVARRLNRRPAAVAKGVPSWLPRREAFIRCRGGRLEFYVVLRAWRPWCSYFSRGTSEEVRCFVVVPFVVMLRWTRRWEAPTQPA